MSNFDKSKKVWCRMDSSAIVDMDELDRLKATVQFLTKLEEGEQSAREKGWLTADEAETALGL